jgi:hypothetical protein
MLLFQDSLFRDLPIEMSPNLKFKVQKKKGYDIGLLRIGMQYINSYGDVLTCGSGTREERERQVKPMITASNCGAFGTEDPCKVVDFGLKGKHAQMFVPLWAGEGEDDEVSFHQCPMFSNFCDQHPISQEPRSSRKRTLTRSLTAQPQLGLRDYECDTHE